MRRRITSTLWVMPAVFLARLAYGQAPGGPLDWWYSHLMMALVWGGLIILILLAIRWFGGSSPGRNPPPDSKSARDVLDERFACGEIDKAEFEERRRVLSE